MPVLTPVITVTDSEKIRHALGDDVYQFSIRIGYSPNAYRFALVSGISPRMGREIARRYGHLLRKDLER
jgi:hypothetical protein